MTEESLDDDRFRDYYHSENDERFSELLDQLYAEIYYSSKDENESYVSNSNMIECNNVINNFTSKENSIQQKSKDEETSRLRASKKQMKNISGTSVKNSECNLNAPEISHTIDLTIDSPSRHNDDNTNDNVSSNSSETLKRKNDERSSMRRKSSKCSKIKHQKISLKKNITCDLNSDTKYNVLQNTAKRKKAMDTKETFEDSSDSEVSIFEVPVPPKPKPPLINLQESDEEDATNSTYKNDPFLKQYRDTNITNGENSKFYDSASPELEIVNASPSRQSITVRSNITSKSTQDESVITIDVDTSTGDLIEDISLNCTMVQKGARSIKEIKQLQKSVNLEKYQVNPSTLGSNSCKKRLQDTSKESSEDGPRTLQETCETPPKETWNQINRMRKNVDGDETNTNCNTANPSNSRYNSRRVDQNFLKNTLLEISCNNRTLAVSQKRQREDDSRERITAEDNNFARKRQCIVQFSEQNISPRIGRNRNLRRSESYWTKYFFKPMPDEMKRFYNDPRGQENFDIDELQRQMPRDPRMWKILDEDLMPSPPTRRRYFNNIKCNNLFRGGNTYKHYSEKTCSTCGIHGHTTWNCPQRMCLSCGTKQVYFTQNCDYCSELQCTLCRSAGHTMNQCPDLWRRYHHITETGRVPQYPGNVMKPASQLHCCNCAKRGHEMSTCTELRGSQHFITPAAVTNYTEGPVYELEPEFASTRPLEMTLSSNFPLPETRNKGEKFKNMSEVNTEAEVYHDLPSSSTDKLSTIIFSKEQVTKLMEYIPLNFIKIIYVYGNFYNKNDKRTHVLITNLSRHEQMSKRAKIFVQQNLSNSQPKFLNLLKHKVEFEIKIGLLDTSEIALELITFKDCIYPLFHLLLYWLNLLNDEKTTGINVLAPSNPTKMLNLLRNSKLPTKLSKYAFKDKDARYLLREMQWLKDASQTMYRKKEYLSTLKKIRHMQTKLLAIAHTEPEPSIHIRNFPIYLERIRQMQTRDKIDKATYLEILLNYNNLFTPHTPPEICDQAKKILKHRKLEKFMRKESASNYPPNTNPSIPPAAVPCTSHNIDFTEDPFMITDPQFMTTDPQNANYDISYKVTDSDIFPEGSNSIENNTWYPRRNLSNVQTISSQVQNFENYESQHLTDNVNVKFNVPADNAYVDTGRKKSKKKKKSKRINAIKITWKCDKVKKLKKNHKNKTKFGQPNCPF